MISYSVVGTSSAATANLELTVYRPLFLRAAVAGKSNNSCLSTRGDIDPQLKSADKEICVGMAVGWRRYGWEGNALVSGSRNNGLRSALETDAGELERCSSAKQK